MTTPPTTTPEIPPTTPSSDEHCLTFLSNEVGSFQVIADYYHQDQETFVAENKKQFSFCFPKYELSQFKISNLNGMDWYGEVFVDTGLVLSGLKII